MNDFFDGGKRGYCGSLGRGRALGLRTLAELLPAERADTRYHSGRVGCLDCPQLPVGGWPWNLHERPMNTKARFKLA